MIKYLVIIFFTLFANLLFSQQWLVIGEPILPDNAIYSLAVDSANNIWIGTNEGGLAKYKNGQVQYWDTLNSDIPHNFVRDIAIDRFGNKWLALLKSPFGSGFSKFNETNFINYDSSNSPLPVNTCFSIHYDKFDNVWIGTSRGLTRFNPLSNTWAVYNFLNFVNKPIISLNDEQYQNTLWIGTILSGFAQKFIINTDTLWKQYTTANSPLTHNTVWDIEIDTKYNKWLATGNGGLNKFNSLDSTWAAFLGGLFYTVLVDDSSQTIWLGTAGGGLWKFKNNVVTAYNPENSPMPGYSVNTIAKDSLNNLLIGVGGGLVIYNENGIVGINSNEILTIPEEFELLQNYPNPFNNNTIIRFKLYNRSHVSLKLFDIRGNEISELINENRIAGDYNILFNASNISSGVYFYTLTTENYKQTRKLIYLK